jgi:hypothetical protein
MLLWERISGTLPALEALRIFIYFSLPMYNITSTNREYQQLPTKNQHTTLNQQHYYIFNALAVGWPSAVKRQLCSADYLFKASQILFNHPKIRRYR